MASINDFKTDLEKESQGVWVPYKGSDFELRIARIGGKKYQADMRRVLKPLRRRVDGGNISEDEAMEVLVPIVAKHLVKDWRGLTDGPDDGPEIPFSIIKCQELLSDPQLKDLYDFIMTVANDGDEFKLDLNASTAGN